MCAHACGDSLQSSCGPSIGNKSRSLARNRPSGHSPGRTSASGRRTSGTGWQRWYESAICGSWSHTAGSSSVAKRLGAKGAKNRAKLPGCVEYRIRKLYDDKEVSATKEVGYKQA